MLTEVIHCNSYTRIVLVQSIRCNDYNRHTLHNQEMAYTINILSALAALRYVQGTVQGSLAAHAATGELGCLPPTAAECPLPASQTALFRKDPRHPSLGASPPGQGCAILHSGS